MLAVGRVSDRVGFFASGLETGVNWTAILLLNEILLQVKFRHLRVIAAGFVPQR